jgi:hypothetical protein
MLSGMTATPRSPVAKDNRSDASYARLEEALNDTRHELAEARRTIDVAQLTFLVFLLVGMLSHERRANG